MQGFVKNSKPLSRKEICVKYSLKWTTAYDNLKLLYKNGLLKKIKRHNNRGRPTILYKPNSEFF